MLLSQYGYGEKYDLGNAQMFVVGGIRNGHSGAFSPKLLKAFAEVKPRFESLMAMYQDEE